MTNKKKTIFIYSGEGTHGSESQMKLLRYSGLFQPISDILKLKHDMDLEQIWNQEIGQHQCPYSPLLTTITQICLSDIWNHWGYQPDLVVGHSTGEISAAYQAGLYDLEEILLLSINIGKVASNLSGAMVHGWLSESELKELPANPASFNFKDDTGIHLTFSGTTSEIVSLQNKKPDFVKMKIPHPWHHPLYHNYLDQLEHVQPRSITDGIFVSGVTTRFESNLAKDHWHQWFIKPIDFIASLQTIKQKYGEADFNIIEIGFHPVLAKCCEIFKSSTYVSSMFRGEDDISWILTQRKKLDPGILLHQLKKDIKAYNKNLDLGLSLAQQGLDSLNFVELTVILQPYFPSLAPQDFYRYKTINQLVAGFGIEKNTEQSLTSSFQRNKVVVAGMSCRLPASVETLPQFWDMLTSKTDQVRSENNRGESDSGFLDVTSSRFDHQYFNIPSAEACTMDPQQILALELTELLWKDAGIDPDSLDKKRVGVYIGAWNQEYQGDSTSVFYPTGTNPSIIASRISYHYDLRGPSWVANTACSSSLLAVHYAAKDIEAGRIDYAIAGGVNMLLDENFTNMMRSSGFLSSDNRCKTFDNSANGYVRAEGGGLVLLTNQSLVNKYYAQVLGSAINQNGGRAQLITAPHPDAQEELIIDACHDAGLYPQEITYIESHGTGTKIGDPIEMSAIHNTIAKDRSNKCYIGSIKSNLGHLESAAGIAGLLKAVTALNHGIIPPNLHFKTPNQFIDFESYPIQVVTEETPIDYQANVGISSFGFGGSNAHIVIKGANSENRKAIENVEVPFDRTRAVPLESYLTGVETEIRALPSDAPLAQNQENIPELIKSLFFNLTGVEDIEPDIELMDQGLDSMSATELMNLLSETLNIEIEPDILFDYPLFDQFTTAIEKQVPERKETPVIRESVENLVSELFFELTGIKTIDSELELTDQGLDSMSATGLVSRLEADLNIEIDPDILFDYPLPDQFLDKIYELTNQT